MAQSVKIKGLKQLLDKLDDYPKEMSKRVDDELSAGAFDIAGLARELAPTDEGRLKNSITAITDKDMHKEVVTNLFYAPYVEFGTGRKVQVPAGLESVAAEFKGPSGRGTFEQMVLSILAWGRRKGIIKGRNQMAQANGLAKRILRNGIKAQPFFFRSLDAFEPKIIENVRKALSWK